MSEPATRKRTREDIPSPAAVLARMLLIRTVEEQLLDLFSAGELFGTTHTCIGQEACAVAVIGALDLERDIVFSTHRCHGHYLEYTDDPASLLAEIMGRETGICRGRGGSQHLCAENFFSNGIQGGIVPVATGTALAEKRKGSGAIAVCFLGDGTLGEGVIYEAFNMASLWNAPVLFVLEHNRYAQSTPTETTTAGNVEARAAAFGIDTDRRAADDVLDLLAHMRDVVARVRQSGRPFFQVLDTYRLAAHSKGDDDRDPAEIDSFREKDPLRTLRERVGVAHADEIAATARAKVDAALDSARNAPFAAFEPAAETESFAARSHHVEARSAFATPGDGKSDLVVHNLNTAMHGILAEDENVVVLGEDLVDPYGGAFKVTRGLSTRFGERVFAAPISEAGIIGIGSGMSLRQLKPVVEIMFGDFLALGADQILNHAAKFRWMYDGKVETPLVVRSPVGGHRGYGPTHSQSIEKMFLGIPGLVVVAISRRHDPGELLRHAVLLDARPVLFLEQKILYSKRVLADPPEGLSLQLEEGERNALYPTGTWRPANLAADVTIVTYGSLTDTAEEAMVQCFEEDEVIAELVVPSQLAPLRLAPILESVRRTGRLVVVEEGTTPWGFGAEVVAGVCEALADTPPRVARVGAHHLPIPNARPAEQQVLPDAARIVEAIRKVTA